MRLTWPEPSLPPVPTGIPTRAGTLVGMFVGTLVGMGATRVPSVCRRYPQKDLTYFTPSCGDCYAFGMSVQDGASMLGEIDAAGGGAKLRRIGGSLRALACAGIGAAVLLTASCSGSSGDIAQPLPSTSSS